MDSGASFSRFVHCCRLASGSTCCYVKTAGHLSDKWDHLNFTRNFALLKLSPLTLNDGKMDPQGSTFNSI